MSLVKYIQSHGIEAWTEENDGCVRLYAVSEAVHLGEVLKETVQLPLCYTSVRTWLGY